MIQGGAGVTAPPRARRRVVRAAAQVLRQPDAPRLRRARRPLRCAAAQPRRRRSSAPRPPGGTPQPAAGIRLVIQHRDPACISLDHEHQPGSLALSTYPQPLPPPPPPAPPTPTPTPTRPPRLRAHSTVAALPRARVEGGGQRAPLPLRRRRLHLRATVYPLNMTVYPLGVTVYPLNVIVYPLNVPLYLIAADACIYVRGCAPPSVAAAPRAAAAVTPRRWGPQVVHGASPFAPLGVRPGRGRGVA
jgi:hypothetical protein